MAGCELCKKFHKDPRNLPCEHSFCFQCLHEYILKVVTKPSMNYFPCPVCHVFIQAPIEDTHAKTWAAFFPKDRLVASYTLAALKQKEYADESSKSSNCPVHSHKPADLYCKTCHVLVCLECIEDSHPRPKCDTVTAEKMVETLRPDLEKLQTDLEEQHQIVAGKVTEFNAATTDRELLASKIQTLKNLDLIQSLINEARAKALEQIRDLRKLCENVYTELDKKKELKAKASCLLTSTDQAKQIMEAANNSGSFEDILRALPYLTYQTNQHDVAITSLQNERETPQIRYTINPDMERFLRKFSEVGVLKYLTVSDVIPDDISEIESVDRCPEQLTFNAKLDGEKRCGIEGAAITDNRIILTDRDSRSLKLFNLAGSLIDQLTLPFSPRRVSPVAKTGEVVVTHSKERSLTYIATHPGLKVLRKAKTSKCYTDIADMGDKYLVASNCADLTLDILELDGHVLKRLRLDFDQNGACAFSWPWFVCATSGGKLLISDRDKGLFCLNVAGELVFAYQQPGIQPRGVRADKDGTIYLARGDNNTVERLSADGKLLDVIVTRRDFVKLPTCLCLSNRRLIVTQYEGSEKVHVFKT